MNVWKFAAEGALHIFFDISNNICETRARVALQGISRNHLLFLVTRSFIDILLYALHAEGFTTPRRNDRYASVPMICIDVMTRVTLQEMRNLYSFIYTLSFRLHYFVLPYDLIPYIKYTYAGYLYRLFFCTPFFHSMNAFTFMRKLNFQLMLIDIPFRPRDIFHVHSSRDL